MPPEIFRGAREARRRDELFGSVRGGMWGKYATGGAPEGSTQLNLGLIAGMLRRLIGWKLSGKTWPHPFFDRATKAPSHSVTTLSADERDALRAKCGPNPSALAPPT